MNWKILICNVLLLLTYIAFIYENPKVSIITIALIAVATYLCATYTAIFFKQYNNKKQEEYDKLFKISQ